MKIRAIYSVTGGLPTARNGPSVDGSNFLSSSECVQFREKKMYSILRN